PHPMPAAATDAVEHGVADDAAGPTAGDLTAGPVRRRSVSVAAQHRHEEAVILWSQCLDLMDGVASDRNKKELKAVRSAMGVYTKRGIPGAVELAERAFEVASYRPEIPS
ncbi:hypothetical protein ACIO3N_40390, partial [Kitasatospora aureofaciens]